MAFNLPFAAPPDMDPEALRRMAEQLESQQQEGTAATDEPPVPDPDKPIKLDLGQFNRLVLPADMVEEIVAVLKQYEKKKILLEDWGLKELIEYGLGMTFLFHGPPGTGKTQCAKIIAEGLGLKLKVYGAAELDSQIPGEYERNVKKAFAQAKKYHEVILFDECDSMLMSRAGMGQIMAAQSNCMLGEIEHHEGVVIMTTNRVTTLDEALERRIALILEFKLPDQGQRLEIWKTLVPKKYPLNKDVKIKELSEFNMTGGQIKNAIVNAARFAISKDEKDVSRKQFDRAISRIMEARDTFAQDKETPYHLSKKAGMFEPDKRRTRAKADKTKG